MGEKMFQYGKRRCFIIQTLIEKWKPVNGYEGLYEVSNFGRVRNSAHKIRKTQINNRGYYNVRLCKNGKYKTCLVHRLVAIAFIPNDDTSLEVNHKDENKQNNMIDNLEWVTRKENMNYGTVQERIHGHKKERSKWRREVVKMGCEMRARMKQNISSQ